MNFRTTLLTFLCGLFFNQLNAQKLSTSNDSNYIYLKTIQTYQDSLLQIKDKYSNWKYQGRDTLANPYYYRLFFQNGLSEDIFSESIGSLAGNNPNSSKTRDKYNYINNLIAHTYTSNPTIIKNYLPSANTKKAPIPADEELYEEHTYVPKSEREVTRKFLEFQSQFRIQDGKISAEVEERKSDTKSIRATLEVQADQITAKVNKNDGSSSTFGWALETASWRIFSGSNTVLKADKNGLEVKGVIRATSGEIGGFKITSNSLTYNNQTWGGTNTNGIYIGPSGIQLGKNFKVDATGNLTAASGTFTGAVHAGNIQYGGGAGYLSGGGISSGSISGNRLVGGTITTAYTSGGINTSLGRADWTYNALNGWTNIPLVKASAVQVSGKMLVFTNITFVNSSGGTTTMPVVTWRVA